jgi:hypothetical protein
LTENLSLVVKKKKKKKKKPSLGLGLLHKIQLNFLEASQQSYFLQGRVVSPTPNPHPGGPGLCICIPQKQGAYPF